MSRRLPEIPPIVHWCEESGIYLNIPVDAVDAGRRMAECPYCGEFLCEPAREPVALYLAVSPRV